MYTLMFWSECICVWRMLWCLFFHANRNCVSLGKVKHWEALACIQHRSPSNNPKEFKGRNLPDLTEVTAFHCFSTLFGLLYVFLSACPLPDLWRVLNYCSTSLKERYVQDIPRPGIAQGVGALLLLLQIHFFLVWLVQSYGKGSFKTNLDEFSTRRSPAGLIREWKLLPWLKQIELSKQKVKSFWVANEIDGVSGENKIPLGRCACG